MLQIGHLQPDIIRRLFKSYCCLFYRNIIPTDFPSAVHNVIIVSKDFLFHLTHIEVIRSTK